MFTLWTGVQPFCILLFKLDWNWTTEWKKKIKTANINE